MHFYDIIMLAVLAAAALFGLWKGLAWQIASFASWFASYLVAYNFRDLLAAQIGMDPPWNTFVAMLVLFLGTALIVWTGYHLLSSAIEAWKLKEFDRQIGALVGLAKGAALCIVVTLFAATLLGEEARRSICLDSTSGHYISIVLAQSPALMPPELQGVVQPYLDKWNQKFDPESYPAPATPPAAATVEAEPIPPRPLVGFPNNAENPTAAPVHDAAARFAERAEHQGAAIETDLRRVVDHNVRELRDNLESSVRDTVDRTLDRTIDGWFGDVREELPLEPIR